MVGKLIFTFFLLTISMLLLTGCLAMAEELAIAGYTGIIAGACFVSMCALILVDVWTT